MVLLQHRHNIVQNNGSITAHTQHRTEQLLYLQHRHNIIHNNGSIIAQTQHHTEQWF